MTFVTKILLGVIVVQFIGLLIMYIVMKAQIEVLESDYEKVGEQARKEIEDYKKLLASKEEKKDVAKMESDKKKDSLNTGDKLTDYNNGLKQLQDAASKTRKSSNGHSVSDISKSDK